MYEMLVWIKQRFDLLVSFPTINWIASLLYVISEQKHQNDVLAQEMNGSIHRMATILMISWPVKYKQDTWKMLKYCCFFLEMIEAKLLNVSRNIFIPFGKFAAHEANQNKIIYESDGTYHTYQHSTNNRLINGGSWFDTKWQPGILKWPEMWVNLKALLMIGENLVDKPPQNCFAK